MVILVELNSVLSFSSMLLGGDVNKTVLFHLFEFTVYHLCCAVTIFSFYRS